MSIVIFTFSLFLSSFFRHNTRALYASFFNWTFFYTWPDKWHHFYIMNLITVFEIIFLVWRLLYGFECKTPSDCHNPLVRAIFLWPLTLIEKKCMAFSTSIKIYQRQETFKLCTKIWQERVCIQNNPTIKTFYHIFVGKKFLVLI